MKALPTTNDWVGVQVAGNGEDVIELCFQSKLPELRLLFEKAYNLRRKYFPDIIYFYVPGMVHFDTSFHRAVDPLRFPALSVTGRTCYLNCEHCRGRLLENMIPVKDPDDMFKICLKIREHGGRGCLISGGSLKDGSVPLMKFIPVIKRIKEELGLKVVIHTGLIGPEIAEALATVDVDGVMLDIIGSNETIKKVYHLDRSVEDFEYSLILLEENDVPTIPHVVVGLHFGKLKGEKEALKIVARHRIAALVIVVFMSLKGTPMENVKPPPPIVVAKVMLAARFLMPNTPLLLGCARPKGLYKANVDVFGIKAGVNGIAYPSEEAYNFATRLGLKVKIYDECCSLLWKEIMKLYG